MLAKAWDILNSQIPFNLRVSEAAYQYQPGQALEENNAMQLHGNPSNLSFSHFQMRAYMQHQWQVTWRAVPSDLPQALPYHSHGISDLPDLEEN